MTLRYEDLQKFIVKLKMLGYTIQISRQHLDFFIAQDFGVSKYIKDNTAKVLVDLGFLELAGVGIFNICDGWRPDTVKDKKDVEKAAEEEADKLLGDLKGAKNAPE